MKSLKIAVSGIAIALSLILFTILNFTYTPEVVTNPSQYYQERPLHSRDGIGKFYQGREIAKVMGHQELLWLERPSREIQEQPNKVVEALNLNPTDVVADIGAGTGYFSFRMASLVPKGKVYAVDIQPEMLDVINFFKIEDRVTNVDSVLGTVSNPNLPENSIDVALMVDAYHEFEYPREMMDALVKSLRSGGRVVLVEYRQENPLIPIKNLHKMTQKQVKKEMNAVGLSWKETQEFLPQQHFIVFQKNV
ncbi:MAG: class I SAM-dependent methyltransferase [Hydrococcus sp. Prado102]|jgi:precorrin-6B methylase 2|nr:class I SAM-dependent methyltransferase [Hydrococcus sp. Prado102]